MDGRHCVVFGAFENDRCDLVALNFRSMCFGTVESLQMQLFTEKSMENITNEDPLELPDDFTPHDFVIRIHCATYALLLHALGSIAIGRKSIDVDLGLAPV